MALMVGVSGVRGLVGQTLTPVLVTEFAQAYGTLLAGGKIALGRDTRASGELYAAAATAGLLAAGCQVTQLGIVMTPTIGHAIRMGGYAGGLMITASHNPRPWNGVKFLDNQGLAPDSARAAEIADIRAAGKLRCATSAFHPIQSDNGAGQRHLDAVLGCVEQDVKSLRGIRVVLDSINGAGCLYGPALLRGLGCDVIHLNSEPNGDFAHEPEPIAENLTQLADAVRQERAGVGFAQDPDADRLAIVDEQGRYIGEEYTLALCAWSVLERRKGALAANLSTSRMIDDVARRHGVSVVRTAVGEANVARGMQTGDCVMGGEGNGGVIDPRICYVRDSLSAMSLVLQLMALTGKSLSQLVAALPRYAMIKQKFECPREGINAAVARTADAFKAEKLNQSDGVRIDFAAGWVHLRALNTEPIVRIIAEAPNRADAEQLIARVRAAAGF